MKILFLSHYFPPEGNAPATRVYEMCRRWVKAGHDVTVITCAPNVPAGKVYAGYKNRFRHTETKDGIRVIRVWTYIAPNKGTIRRILNYLSYFFSATLAAIFGARPDIVIATSPQFFCGWAGVVVAKLKRRPFILEIRDIWPESILAVGAMKKGRLIKLLEWMETHLYRAAKHIVTVGEGYKNRLIEKGVPAEKISVITNGIDPAIMEPRSKDVALAERYRLGNHFVCAYIGTIGMACGLDIILRAAERLQKKQNNHIRFLLVGDGARREYLEQRAHGLRNVTFTGLQPREQIPAYLSISDVCLVHLAKRELFQTVLPSKMIEACAMGKPVILGVEGYAADLLQRMKAGICIEPENENNLLTALEQLAGDKKRIEQMGHSGRNYVIEHFNLDTLASQYLDIIRRESEK